MSFNAIVQIVEVELPDSIPDECQIEVSHHVAPRYTGAGLM